jgi:hypothetical protein
MLFDSPRTSRIKADQVLDEVVSIVAQEPGAARERWLTVPTQTSGRFHFAGFF